MNQKLPSAKSFSNQLVKIKTALILALLFINIIIHAQCPCACSSCTWTVSTTVATNYTVDAGQTLCIVAGGNVTGSITLKAGGTVCNSSSITPSGISFFTGGTFNNCGTITGSFSIGMDDNDEFLYNCSGGTIHLTSGGITLNGGGYFQNDGLVTLDNGDILDQGGDVFINNGTITINNGGDFTANGSTNAFCNNGTINLTAAGSRFLANGDGMSNHGLINAYDFDLNGNDFYNACTITVLHDFFANGGSMTGPTTAGQYGRYSIAGSSGYNGCDVGLGGGHIDICDAGAPVGGWDSRTGGTIGAGVTYCAHTATCSGTGTCTIPCTMAVPTITGTTTICPGINTTLTAGGSGTYLWNTGATTSTLTVSPSSTTTYTLTVTNSCGSTAKAQVVTVNSAPTPTINNSGSNTICNGTTITLTGGGGGTYSWNTGVTTAAITITPSSTTTYTLTVTNGSGCTSQKTKVITVDAVPTPGLTGTATICNGVGVTLTGTGGGTYSWNTGATTTAITISPSSNTTYTVTVTNAASCTAKATGAVTVNATPTPGITGTTTLCNGVGTTLTGTGGGTYSWNTGATTTAISVTPGSTTTYTVTVTNASSCTAKTTQVVTVNALPTPGISGTSTLCNGIGTTLTGSGGGTYSWNTGATSSAITVSPSSNTTYTLTVTNASACTAKATQAVTVNTVPTATVTSTPAACGGSTGTATVTATGTGTLTYSWTPSGQTTLIAVGLSSGSYTVKVTDGNGCTKNASVSVNNATGPTATLASQGNVLCTGAATGTATVSGSGGTGTLTYSWSPGGQTTTAVTALTAGTYICTVTDVNGCAQGQSVTITQPAAAISSGISSQNNVGCTGAATGTATVTVSGGTGGYTYNWSPMGGTNSSATGLTTGSYNVTITDGNGCTYIQTVAITQPASALGSTVSSQSNVGCTGAATGSATVTGTGGTPVYTYLWNTGGTTADATGLTTGTYSVTITDANGCTKEQTVAITQPASALGSTITGQNNVGCTGAATGTATVTGTGGTPIYTYNWSTGETTASVSGLTTGTYSVTITDSNGCTKEQTVAITQPASAIGSTVTGQANVGCTGAATGTATVTGTGGTPGYTYNWSTGATTASINGLTTGIYNVTVTDANGCTVDQPIVITQPASAIGSSIYSQGNVGCTGASTGDATVTATGGTPGYTYSWSPAGGTDASAINLSAGTYSVTITDSNGCTKLETATITQPTFALGSNISSQNDVNCTGSATGSAQVSGTGGTPNYSYDWQPLGSTGPNASGLTAGTYTVTVSDLNGCTTNQIVTITQPATAVSATSSAVNAICGIANGTASVTASGGTPGTGYTYLWSPSGGTNSTASGLSAGAYTVVVTDANGCTATTDVSVNNAGSPSVSIVSQVPVGCTGSATGSASVTATGGTPNYSYNWTPMGGTNATATGLTVGTYNCTVTDANGCIKVQTVSITQPASALGSTISGQDNVGCTGSATGSATVTGTGGTPTYTYNWNTGETTSSVTGLTAGTYSVTITDNNGCTKEQTVAITQPASALSSSISNQNNVGCTGGATGNATVIGTGGTPTYTYNWSNGETTAVVSGLTVGSYSVIVTDFYGCSSTQSVAITQPASALNSNISSTNPTCGSSNGTASITALGGTPTYTYNWSDGTSNSTTNGLSAGTYSVTVTDLNGCSKTSSITITNAGSPAVSITSQSNANCNGSATGTATVSASGGTPTYTYSWAPTGGTDAIAIGLTAGSYTCTVSDLNNCTQIQTVTISEPAVLSSNISSQSNVECTGSATGSASITASGGTPIYTYSWAPITGTDDNVNGLTAGTYTCTISDTKGCSQTQMVTITEPATNLSATVSSQNDVGCKGNATGSATVTGIGGTPNYSYTWQPAVSSGPTATGLSAGTYTVIVSDLNGCTAIQSVVVAEPTADLSSTLTSTNDVSCSGGNNATAKITVSGGTPLYNYNWSPNVGTTDTLSSLTAGTYVCTITDAKNCTQTQTVTIIQPVVLSSVVSSQTDVKCNGDSTGMAIIGVTGGTSGFIYSWTPNVSSTNTASGLKKNTYTVTITDSKGCTSETQVTINEPLPFTLTVSSSATVCAGETVTLTATPNGGTGTISYVWSPTGPVVTPLVPTTYKVTGIDGNGCMSLTDSIIVTPLPAPTAGFDTLSSGMFNQKYNFLDQSTNANKWSWDFGDGHNTSTLQNPFHTFPGAGTYTVTQIVTNPSGCTDTAIKIIVIRPNYYIPNVFTPNHDGVNDEFWIPNSGFESFELTIFDRWGIKLFVTDQGEIRWDGRTAAGQEVPDGTYFFMLKAKLISEDPDQKSIEEKGFIDLHRSN